jgi:type I restriction enzyme S subunit
MSAIHKLLTDHIDIWTAADTEKKSGRGRSSGNAVSVYGIKKLRELILELAVHGKLVPQDPNDEPASELLKRILDEKAPLDRDRTKRNQSPKMADADIENLPLGWVHTTIGTIMISRDSERIPVSSEERSTRGKLYDYYGASGVIDKIDSYIFDKPLLLIGEDGANLINRSTPIAFIARGKYWVNNHAHVLDGINEEFLRYIEIHINAIDLKPYVTGTAQPKMNQAKMNTIPIFLPPLAEQPRIVAKVDELMALCDQLETQHINAADAHEKLVGHLLGTLTESQNAEDFSDNWQRIAAHFDTLFTTEASIDALKQTLLQLAVMGKLVPQDPNDEPASELLTRIKSDRVKLVANGNLKKDKPLSPIPDEEKPFQLPKSWEWVRLRDLMPDFQNGASSRGDKDGVPVVVLRLADIKDRRISLEEPRRLLISANAIDKYSLAAGDVLIVRVNGSAELVGGFIECDTQFSGIYCDHFIRMRISQEVLNAKFLSMVGASELVRRRIKGLFITTAGQKTVNQNHIGSLVIPLLSVSEQLRIVNTVNQIFGLCDLLIFRLTDANKCRQEITKVLVEQALA